MSFLLTEFALRKPANLGRNSYFKAICKGWERKAFHKFGCEHQTRGKKSIKNQTPPPKNPSWGKIVSILGILWIIKNMGSVFCLFSLIHTILLLTKMWFVKRRFLFKVSKFYRGTELVQDCKSRIKLFIIELTTFALSLLFQSLQHFAEVYCCPSPFSSLVPSDKTFHKEIGTSLSSQKHWRSGILILFYMISWMDLTASFTNRYAVTTLNFACLYW